MSNPWIKTLKTVLSLDKYNHIWLQIATMFIFPVTEAVLASVVASTIYSNSSLTMPLICLLAVFIPHLVLGVILINRSNSLPPSIVAEALEDHERLCTAENELLRRNESYKMVRAAFDALNTETCKLDEWCEDEFEICLHPIIQPLMNNINTILGVSGSQYTFELHLKCDAIYFIKHSKDTLKEESFDLVYFFGSNIDKSKAESLPKKLLLIPIFSQNVPKKQSIYDDPSVFCLTGTTEPRPEIYFTRYVAHPIYEACSTNPLGVILLTSRQISDFAPDVIDTMGFISSLLSRFIFAYNECLTSRMNYRTDRDPMS